MCNANKEILAKVSTIIELKKMVEELNLEIDALSDEIKSFMGEAETMVAGAHTVKYTTVVSNRVDTAALKKLFGAEALEPYTKRIQSRRFSIN